MTQETSAGLSPAQLEKEGKKAYQQGDYLPAAKSFEAAAQALRTVGDELNAAEMMNNVSVAYLQAEQPQEALQAVEGTPELFAAAGDIRRQGVALGNYGAALEALHRTDEALSAYQQSGDLLNQAGEKDLYMHVMQSLSSLQLRSGRRIEALGSMNAALDDAKRLNPAQRMLKGLLDTVFKMLNK